jgi:hypothetical protein
MKSKMPRLVGTGLTTALGLGLWMLVGTSWAACLQKTGPNGAAGPTYMFMLAPESAVARYLSLGFNRINCPSDLSAFRNYAAQICAGTTGGGIPPMNTDLVLGVPRERACADAKAGLTEVTDKVN